MKKTFKVEHSKSKVTHKIGNIYMLHGSYYILAHVDNSKVALVSLSDGNRYENTIQVPDVNTIIEQEFDEICAGSEYKLAKEVEYKITF